MDKRRIARCGQDGDSERLKRFLYFDKIMNRLYPVRGSKGLPQECGRFTEYWDMAQLRIMQAVINDSA